MKVHWKINRLKSSHDDVIAAIDNFLINEIQALQHRRKKCMNCKGNYEENKPHLVTFHESILVSQWAFQPILVYTRRYIYSSRGVVAKVLDCDIIVSEFELQFRYYIHFGINTVGKGMNSLTLQAIA